MSIRVENFGKTKDGIEIKKISLENSQGNIASFISFGAIWSNMLIKDKNGNIKDVVQGFDDIAGYEYNKPHLGSPIGRYANRISNAKIEIDGVEYKLEANKGIHNLHSGMKYWDKRVWDFETKTDEEGDSVIFKLFSPDGDQGFPGNANVEITYTFNDNNALVIAYKFISDKKTAVNLTNHAYFNLEGTDSTSISEQIVSIDADEYNFLDEDSVATEIIRRVENTPLDFRVAKKIGKDIDADFDSLNWAGGYDQNFILNKEGRESYKSLEKAASAFSEETGILMEVYTDLEGVQFYTANGLAIEMPGKNGHFYGKRSSFCFETGHFPNAVNIKTFKSPLVEADKEYITKTAYKFSV